MGQLNLPDGAIVYIDTAIIIYTLEGNEDYLASLEPLWDKFQSSNIELMTSELTLLETLVQPLKNNNSSLAAAYEEFLTASMIQLIPVSRSILKNAAQRRKASRRTDRSTNRVPRR